MFPGVIRSRTFTDDTLVVGQVGTVLEAGLTSQRVRVFLATRNNCVHRQTKARVEVADRSLVALVAFVQINVGKGQTVKNFRLETVFLAHGPVQIKPMLAVGTRVLIRIKQAPGESPFGAFGPRLEEEPVQTSRAGDRVRAPRELEAVAHGRHALLRVVIGSKPQIARVASVPVHRVFHAFFDKLEVPLEARAVVLIIF